MHIYPLNPPKHSQNQQQWLTMVPGGPCVPGGPSLPGSPWEGESRCYNKKALKSSSDDFDPAAVSLFPALAVMLALLWPEGGAPGPQMLLRSVRLFLFIWQQLDCLPFSTSALFRKLLSSAFFSTGPSVEPCRALTCHFLKHLFCTSLLLLPQINIYLKSIQCLKFNIWEQRQFTDITVLLQQYSYEQYQRWRW